MPEPQNTAAPVTEPSGGTVTLVFGGELSVVPVDEHTYRLSLDVEGGHFSYPMTALDLWSLRALTGDLVMQRVTASEAAA